MDSNQDPEHFSEDCLPPEGIYSSREEVLTQINAWAAPRGYAFVVGRSRKTANGRQSIVFACDRGAGRIPELSDTRQRLTSTRRTGCAFSVIAKESLCKTRWTLKHRDGSQYNTHNHMPSLHLTAHPTHRQLSNKDRSLVQGMANAGIAPREIRSYLRSQSDTLATQQDIHNCIAQGKRELMKGQSSIHALANELDKEGFWSRMRLDQNNRVTDVFFAHPRSLAYLKSYPDLVILDCTYKTNKYRMPLLDIVGVDACQRSFCIAFAFLSGEEEGDYIWALERLRSMYELCGAILPSVILIDRCLACMNAVARCFPIAVSLLCRWHANKAVLRYCLPTFTQGGENPQGIEEWKEFYNYWHRIIATHDERTYHETLTSFKTKYTKSNTREVGYIMETWLDLYKEKLVAAWTNQHLHFENVVTSRGEGIHQLIKMHLKTSQLDLFEAWRSIKLAILNQISELEANQANQQIRTPIELSGVLYSNIRGWVSHEALRKVEKQRKQLSEECPPCTGLFTKSLGLPCSHILKPLIQQKQPLQLYHFHQHWHLQREGTPRILIEPFYQVNQIVLTQQATTSTQREPCAFEGVEKLVQPKAPPKCSKCHQIGHRMTSMICPLRYDYLLQDSTSKATSIVGPAAVPIAAITAVATTAATTAATTSTATSTATITSPSLTAPILQYNHPYSIFQRYQAARSAWYATQPQGALRTNQLYRKAMGLPQRYSKASYQWCIDYKQMGQYYISSNGRREWTKEEMMSYLDWDKAEDERVERSVGAEMADKPFSSRRGMQDIWDAAARAIANQGHASH